VRRDVGGAEIERYEISNVGLQTVSTAGQGQYYELEFNATAGTPPFTTPKFSISLRVTNTIIYLGSTYLVQFNIPPIKQLDIVKYIALKYGLLVDFDTFTNTLVWYNYGALYDAYSAGNYIDLTNKIVNTRKLGFDFSGNFSKSNQLNYTNESGMQPQQGRGLFAVNNYNLPDVGEFGKTTFGFSDSLFSVQRQVAVLPYAKVIREENAIVNTELETINNRVVRLYNQARATTFRRYWIMDTVDFQHSVDTFYTDFVASNENYRLVTVQADLSYSDVKLLASKTEKLPVLVSLPNLQGVFLVVKIDRFSENRPTSIQLKKLL
jgi:hypothetical protein